MKQGDLTTRGWDMLDFAEQWLAASKMRHHRYLCDTPCRKVFVKPGSALKEGP
jgi:hypothetical protein